MRTEHSLLCCFNSRNFKPNVTQEDHAAVTIDLFRFLMLKSILMTVRQDILKSSLNMQKLYCQEKQAMKERKCFR
eukprot:m.91579 g.91579  ORF g.91579 m.91579 type:complete len:75 (+) comp36698_c0_seq15:1002-1226(+)